MPLSRQQQGLLFCEVYLYRGGSKDSIPNTAAAGTLFLDRRQQGFYLCHRSGNVYLYHGSSRNSSLLGRQRQGQYL